MKHFTKIAANIDVVPVLNALANHPELWDAHTLRTTHPGTAHSDVSDIWVFFNAVERDVTNEKEVIEYPAWRAMPQLRSIVFDLMRRVEGVQLGRVLITKLPPGRSITPHVDGGAPAIFYARYQIALQSLPGCMFMIGEETVQFETGEAWLIDNETIHAVMNNSSDDRLALIVDIRLG